MGSEGDLGYDMLKPASSVECGSSPVVKAKLLGHLPLQLLQVYFLGNQK